MLGTEEEAAEAYDIAAIKFRGLNAVTNFEINRYDVKSILESSTLPIGGAAKRLKDAEKAEMALNLHRANESNLNLHLTDGQMAAYGNPASHASWPTIAFQQPQSLSMYPYQRLWCKQEHDTDISHGYNGDINHHLQLGNNTNTHNFLQPNSVLHNIMALDSSSMDHGSGYGANGSTAMMMGGTVIVQDGNHQSHGNGFLANEEGKSSLDYEAMYGSGDAYQQARNFYYQSHQTSSNLAAATASTNWIPTAVPTARTANNMAACNGASTFTVWNDA